MLYVDIPTATEIRSLVAARHAASVSIYLPTTHETQHIGPARIELGNLGREADAQLEAAGVDKRTRWAVAEQIGEVADDDDFWMHQATSLALLVTPEGHRTYRLPTHLAAPLVQVSDRFHLKPLFRVTTQPAHAFVLALEENAVRLVEVFSAMPAQTVRVPDLPKDAASAVGRKSVNRRPTLGDAQGGDQQKLLLRQYARKVDAALRPVLAGRSEPLFLAATEPLLSLYRSVSSYPGLAEQLVTDSPARMTDAEIAAAVRPLLDAQHAARIAEFADLYRTRSGAQRATGDIAEAARAATMGAVAMMAVDIDEVVPGMVEEETGAVTFADAASAGSYGIVDEIAARVIMTGGEVLGVRREDIPGGGSLAAILRYPL